jgi:uncharacterized protein
MHIVLDTNVLLVALPVQSPFHPIFQAIRNEKISLFLSNDILTEYEEKLGERYGEEITYFKLKEILRLTNVHLKLIYYEWQLIEADPDDNKFADCAIASNADYLVSNDGHFKILKTINYPKVNVIKAEDFLSLLDTITD